MRIQILAAIGEAALQPRAALGVALAEAGHHHADSPHQLVMDMHKRLNAMQAALAEEIVDGAATTALVGADRPLVAAFMAGLHRTARLKLPACCRC